MDCEINQTKENVLLNWSNQFLTNFEKKKKNCNFFLFLQSKKNSAIRVFVSYVLFAIFAHMKEVIAMH